MRLKHLTFCCILICCLQIVVHATLSEHGLQVEGEQIVTEADGEDAVVEDDVVEELPKEAETIPRHATGRLVHIPEAGRYKRNAIKPTETNRWPNNTFYYQLDMDPPLKPKEAEHFAEALEQYAQYTCIKMVNSDEAPYRARIHRGTGCWSVVGRSKLKNQPQKLSLGGGCLSQKKTPMHELMHALGVNHEQSRPDRDDYIHVDFENIRQGKQGNFARKDPTSASLYGTDYSYESIMHYGSKFFANDKTKYTIYTIDPSEQLTIGRVKHFSFEDLQLLNRMYSCDCGEDAPVCSGHSYLGPDCQCQFKQADLTPAPCAPCFEPGIACECLENGCDTVQNSTCSQDTKACECDTGYVKIGIRCVQPSTIICPAVGVHCHCSLNDPSACEGHDENSVCNTETEKCECLTGYAPQSGVCVDVTTVSCTDLEEPCFCSHKAASECSANVDSFSGCDVNTDSCVCLGGFLNQNGTCIPDPKPGYKSDGEFLAPFVQSDMSSIKFAPASTNDNSGNQWVLKARSSKVDAVAAFETHTIALKGDWCVSLGFRLKSAKVSVGYSIGGGEWLWRGWENEKHTTYFVDADFHVNNPSTIKFRVVAEEYKMPPNKSYWAGQVDPISIVPCTTDE